jgi:hypothetical protein
MKPYCEKNIEKKKVNDPRHQLRTKGFRRKNGSILEVFFRHKPRHRNYVEYNMK